MVAGAGVGQIAKLVASLVSEGGLEKIIEKKLVAMGGDFLLSQLGVAMPGNLLGDISNLMPKALSVKDLMPQQLQVNTGFLRMLTKDFVGKKTKGNWRARSAWGRSNWARGRDDWLDNHWKHDWRSQPRDALGKWVPGRLTYVETQLQYKGKKAGRRTKRRRALRRQARRRGRRAAKMAFRMGGED
jgi:hypothetical protein